MKTLFKTFTVTFKVLRRTFVAKLFKYLKKNQNILQYVYAIETNYPGAFLATIVLTSNLLVTEELLGGSSSTGKL